MGAGTPYLFTRAAASVYYCDVEKQQVRAFT